jgi:hypothetical protein
VAEVHERVGHARERLGAGLRGAVERVGSHGARGAGQIADELEQALLADLVTDRPAVFRLCRTGERRCHAPPPVVVRPRASRDAHELQLKNH